MKHLYKLLIITSSLCICLTSCNEKAKLKRAMSDFMESEIVIPNEIECIYNRQVDKIKLDTLQQLKLIVYYDSLDCSSCRISHLMDIYPLYDMADTSNFSLLTIFSPKEEDLAEVRNHIVIQNLPIPIYIDADGSFSKLNKSIPSDKRFHSFLIDDNNKPVFVGNPLTNSSLEEVLKTILEEHQNTY